MKISGISPWRYLLLKWTNGIVQLTYIFFNKRDVRTSSEMVSSASENPQIHRLIFGRRQNSEHFIKMNLL
jgi:hypothetical protein